MSKNSYFSQICYQKYVFNSRKSLNFNVKSSYIVYFSPENVPRLYNLIRIEDERVAPAFYYALRDTLVVNDLDQGTRIAYGRTRYRVVTLKGDLIETSGAMSGGGKSVMRGRMGQQVTMKTNLNETQQVEEMKEELQNQEARITELRKKQVTLEPQIDTLTKQLQKMKIDFEKLRSQIQACFSIFHFCANFASKLLVL